MISTRGDLKNMEFLVYTFGFSINAVVSLKKEYLWWAMRYTRKYTESFNTYYNQGTLFTTKYILICWTVISLEYLWITKFLNCLKPYGKYFKTFFYLNKVSLWMSKYVYIFDKSAKPIVLVSKALPKSSHKERDSFTSFLYMFA